MTKQHADKDARQAARPSPTCSPRIAAPLGTSVIVGGMCFLASAWAAEPSAFLLQADGFNTAVVGDAQGRFVQSWPGQPHRVSPGRWVTVDRDAKRSVWFDDAGHVSARGPYVEVRSPAFARHPGDPDQSPLFSTWSEAGIGLLHADGRVFLDWQPEGGQWTGTTHPQRYSWRSRVAGERIFDQNGSVRLQLHESEMRAAGPFADRPQYLVCDATDGTPCTLRDEAGTTLWTRQVDDLLPLTNGGWLGRRGNAWRRLDASGQPVAADRTRVYAAGQFFPRVRRQAGSDPITWPRWMTQYRIEREDAADIIVDEDSAVGGLMQADGRFVAVARATSGKEVCHGVWRFAMRDGPDRLGDAEGRLTGTFKSYSWTELEAHPELRMAIAEDGQVTIVDCSGRRGVDTPPLLRLTEERAGLLGTLVNEDHPRLWVDADLQTHLLPQGNAIEETSADGALLVVRTPDNVLRLYQVKRGAFVGGTFSHSETLLPEGVVFFRDGYRGFMDGEGNERLPPRYNAILSWGGDRLWTSHYADADTLDRPVVSLHRMDGTIIGSWLDVIVSDSPILRDLPDQGPVTQLVGRTFKTANGNYFGQQWIDRDGRTLFLAMHCFGTSRETQGAVIEPLQGMPRRTGAHCVIPDDIRGAMAMLPADDPISVVD